MFKDVGVEIVLASPKGGQPPLALHVKTGLFCCYEPDMERSVSWTL